MRRFAWLSLCLLLAACRPGAVRIDTPQGVLRLEPLAEDAIRVRMTPKGAPTLETQGKPGKPSHGSLPVFPVENPVGM